MIHAEPQVANSAYGAAAATQFFGVLGELIPD